jgi:hypothetical protein
MNVISSIYSFDNSKFALIDHKSKLVMFWSPRAGGTAAVSMFYKNMGIFDAAIQEFPWIHHYTKNVFFEEHGFLDDKILNDPSYYKFKIVRDPYNRAVSCYFVLASMVYNNEYDLNISFRDFLKKIKDDFDFGHSINYHSTMQHSENDKLLNKIIKIEEIDTIKEIDDTCGTKLKESFDYILSKKSTHTTIKNRRITKLVADIPARDLVSFGFPDYLRFYDEETKELVTSIYKEDIERYGYQYPF